MTSLGRGFDAVADLYDDVRPEYPDEVYDAIDRVTGGLRGADALDLAAGTGVATRALRARGAHVVAIDPGEPMLRRLRAISPDVPVIVAEAERLPLRADTIDVVTCATAWHWLDASLTVGELRRVVRPGGHLALYWANNRWGDEAIEWEVARSAVYDRWDTNHGSRPEPERYRGVIPSEAAADLRARGLDVVVESDIVWTRECSRQDHVRAIATHSDVIALGERKQQFLDEVAEALAPWPVVTERLWGPLVIARV